MISRSICHSQRPGRLSIVGDFDGDGLDDLGTWADNTFQVDLAEGVRRGWDGDVDAEFVFGFAGVLERPIAADIDMDGFADLGLWVPGRSGAEPPIRASGTCLFPRAVPCWTVSSLSRFATIRWFRSRRRLSGMICSRRLATILPCRLSATLTRRSLPAPQSATTDKMAPVDLASDPF